MAPFFPLSSLAIPFDRNPTIEAISMEEAIKDQPSVHGKSKLRYPLRSATKSKEEKQSTADTSNSSATKRGRIVSKVSQSVSVLDSSTKDTAAKPPRRFSIPAKSNVSPHMKPAGNITPISETRAKRSVTSQGKIATPVSDVSKSGNRRNSSYISSATYWLSQIKLSESAAMHSISLGFFKLALEAGCKPLQRMREELKSYARRNSLGELGESVKELFSSYEISENLEQLQVSETCSQVPGEGTRSSDDDVHSSSSTRSTRKLKPKSLNTDAAQVSSVTESANKETTQKNNPATRVRGSLNKNSVNTRSVSDSGSRNLQRKPQKPSKQDSKTEKVVIKKQGKKSANEEGPVNSLPTEETTLQENKENMDAPLMEETSLTEVM